MFWLYQNNEIQLDSSFSIFATAQAFILLCHHLALGRLQKTLRYPVSVFEDVGIWISNTDALERAKQEKQIYKSKCVSSFFILRKSRPEYYVNLLDALLLF